MNDEPMQMIDEPHVYELLPGMAEWKFASLSKRRAACYISREEAEHMTTDALLETVLNYPFMVDMYAFNSLEYGVKVVCQRFPALDVLLRRQDVEASIDKLEAEAFADGDEGENSLRHLFCTVISGFSEKYAAEQ